MTKSNLSSARVLISVPEDFLKKVDEVAEKEDRSRSELIREALRSYMHRAQLKRNFENRESNAEKLMTLLED